MTWDGLENGYRMTQGRVGRGVGCQESERERPPALSAGVLEEVSICRTTVTVTMKKNNEHTSYPTFAYTNPAVTILNTQFWNAKFQDVNEKNMSHPLVPKSQ